MLNGVDIASHQKYIDVYKVNADFIIVKVSGGTSYVNDRAHEAWRDWRDIANDVLKSGKLLGLYHYACEYGSEPGGRAEADFFLKQIKGFEGKAALFLDWEAHAQEMPVSYAKAWLDTVAKATGATPMFYGYASYINSRDHSQIANYPLWMASYLDRYVGGTGYVTDPTNTWKTGSWSEMKMYQYASTRTVKGYAGRLDVNVFYGSKADWEDLAGGKGADMADMIDVADVAAAIHADMCNDAANGYSWEPRWGEDGLGVKKLTIGGREYQYDRGSYDCSSSVITACNEALRYTKHKDALKAATYTGNMRKVFHDSGLFDIWPTATTIAKRGDVYLNDANHTAMCQDDDPDMLSEFSINENGGCYGGKVGDQTGREAWIHDFYEYPWNVTLHWKGKVAAAEPAKQTQAKLAVDGVMGPLTISELQRQLKVNVTKKMDKETVKALQRALNAGRLK